jgi:uncharacterized membrane protein
MDTTATTAPAEERDSGALTYILLAVVLAVALIFAFNSSAVPNHWYGVFKAIHVIAAVAWVGGGTLLTILAIVAERSSDPTQIAGVARQAATVGEKFFAPAGLVTLLMGIAMMINTSWGWGTFWIDAGLVGYAVSFLVGILVIAPRAKRLHATIEAHGPTHPDSITQVKAIMLIARFDVALLLLVVADMVTKPFS